MGDVGDVERCDLEVFMGGEELFGLPGRLSGEHAARSLTKNFCNHSFDIDLGAEFAKARDAVGVVEIPVVLLRPLEVADRGILCPGAPKRRKPQLIRHAVLKEDSDIGLRVDRFDRRQVGRILHLLPMRPAAKKDQRGRGAVISPLTKLFNAFIAALREF